MIRIVACLVVLLSVVNGVEAQEWRSLRHQADSLFEVLDVSVAATKLANSLALARKDPNVSPATIDSMEVSLSDWYTICMQYHEAGPVLEAIVRRREEHKNYDSRYIHALTNLGFQNVYRENFDTAYRLFLKSDSLAELIRGDRNFLQAENLMGLARYYLALMNYDSALIHCQAAIGLYSSQPAKFHAEFSVASSTASQIYLRLGDVANAESHIKRALKRITDTTYRRHPYYMETFLNLYEYLAITGNYDSAQQGFRKSAISLVSKLGEHNPLAITLFNNRGYLFVRSGQPLEARREFLHALKELSMDGMEQSMFFFKVKNNEANSYLFSGDFKQADSVLAVADKMVVDQWGDDHSFRATTQFNLALGYAGEGRLDDAARAHILSGKIFRDQLQRDIAGLSEKEQLGLYNMVEITFQSLPSFLHNHPGYRTDSILLGLYDEQSFQKGIINYNQQKLMRQIRSSGDTVLLKNVNEWISNRQLLSAALSRKTPKKYSDSLMSTTLSIERKIMARSKAFASTQNMLITSYQEISAGLKKNEVAIEFIKYRLFANGDFTDSSFYAAVIIIPGSRAPVFVDLCTEKKLFNVLRPYYSGDTSNNKLHDLYRDPLLRKKGMAYGADSLYKLIWQPMEKYLPEHADIIMSPIALINLIAFPALPFKNKLLGDSYQFIRLQRLPGLLNAVNLTIADVKEVKLWGGIEYGAVSEPKASGKTTLIKSSLMGDKPWSPLLYTGQETADIKNIFLQKKKHVLAFTKTNATRNTFVKADFSQPSIIHVATHGFYTRDSTEQPFNFEKNYSFNTVKTQDPLMRSGLVFAGANLTPSSDPMAGNQNSAILTSYDIASMNLDNVRLATLSACETAMGDIESGEGVFGLQRALKQAGVHKMILTLWPVSDRQTQGFMTTFYKKLAEGAPVRKAFLATQRTMRKTNTPEFWAGFILVE